MIDQVISLVGARPELLYIYLGVLGLALIGGLLNIAFRTCILGRKGPIGVPLRPGAIFISYRRADSHQANRVREELNKVFGDNAAWLDTSSIGGGDRFADRIFHAISDCRVTLVLIGENWISVSQDEPQGRLFRQNDLVRREVASALQLGKVVVPIRLDNHSVPDVAWSIQEIAQLAELHALNIRRDPDFGADMTRLCDRIAELCWPKND